MFWRTSNDGAQSARKISAVRFSKTNADFTMYRAQLGLSWLETKGNKSWSLSELECNALEQLCRNNYLSRCVWKILFKKCIATNQPQSEGGLMLGEWHGGCRKYLIWRYTNQMSPTYARTRGKSVRKRHSSHCETLAPVAIQQQLRQLTETGLHRPRWVRVISRSGRLRSIRNMLPDLLWSEVAAYLEFALVAVREKGETPSVSAFLPSPSVCFLSSRILNF